VVVAVQDITAVAAVAAAVSITKHQLQFLEMQR
jgi:hypothetical protein